ncbi:NAD-dependent epimerase/dehydratase family protein [Thermoplasmatales archaeon AK]|nr:NAD-dependent epimerase/dehydratase family protein [Thermoplasmatales archaeon AK]
MFFNPNILTVQMKGKRVIVTGGAGFIGSNLVKTIVEDNEVLVIDNMHTGSLDNLRDSESENLKVINDDVKNINMTGYDADIVFHLGFYSASPMYRNNPFLVSEVVSGMLSVLEFAKENESKVVFSSTSSIYNGIEPPHRESVIPKVTDYYTEARIACERLGQLYSDLHGLDVAAMRFFSVYGANLATQFLWSMKKDEPPVIYGDGTQRRDFVFVTDVVDALVKATSISGFEVFNVGFGKNYSLNELVEKLNRILRKNIKPRYISMPVKNYVHETLADMTKVKNKLKFQPKIDLDTGLNLINEYYQ